MLVLREDALLAASFDECLLLIPGIPREVALDDALRVLDSFEMTPKLAALWTAHHDEPV